MQGKYPPATNCETLAKKWIIISLQTPKKILKTVSKQSGWLIFINKTAQTLLHFKGSVIHNRQIFTYHGQLSQPDLIVYSEKGEKKAVQKQFPYPFLELDDLDFKGRAHGVN